jgi:hypothetical protein
MNAQSETTIQTAPPTQNERLLTYLQSHTEIDPLTAWRELGIARLSARVLDLRAGGHEITSGRKTVKNAYSQDCIVASYCLVPVVSELFHVGSGSI